MKKPARFLRVLGVAGLLIGLFAATIVPAVAQEDDTPSQDGLEVLIGLDDAGLFEGDGSIFYPWVANDDDFGLGAADTSISVQNLEDEDAEIAIAVGDGAGGWDVVTTAFLSAFAAKSFSAEDLGIAEGEGAPVWVIAFGDFEDDIADDVFPDAGIGDTLVETPVILSKPEGVEGDFTQVIACVVNAYAEENDLSGDPVGFVVAAPFTFEGVAYAPDDDDETTTENSVFEGSFTQADLQAILEDAQAGSVAGELVNPFGGLNNDGDCFDADLAGELGLIDSVSIGGVAKQAVDGESLPTTTGADTAVSGYNAVNGLELAQFDEWYLPIVQTNCGPGGCWDSMLRVANFNNLNNAVTIRFFPADDGSGSLQTGFQIQANVDGGDTWNVNLGDLVPEGWVGSAHIFSDGAVFAMVDRYKVGYDMWLTNTGSSADFENIAQVEGSNGRFALFAPHVLMDYFGWNTGINVANVVDTDNNVSVQYFNMLGNATEVLNQRLAAHGMTYFYDPSQAPQDNNAQDETTDANAGIVGSAIIWSDAPVAVAVDATKYPESDPNGGSDILQGTSYSATANVFTWQAVPLVQKGNPVDGSGDTSGINIMNPNSVAVTANVYWVNPSGFLADNFGTSSVTIPGFANGFVYTLTQHNLPNGFTGAAQVVASAPVAVVSANVNYQVEGDGAAIFNAFNPCGFFRVAANCSFGDVFTPGGQSVTKTFVDAAGAPVSGVNFSIVNTPSTAAFQRDGVSGVDGSATFSNVPVGVYDLFVNSVPEGFVAPDALVAADTFTVSEGEDVVLENVLSQFGGLTKFVCDETNTLEDGCQTEQNEIQEISAFGTAALIGCNSFAISFGNDPFPANTAFFAGNCDATAEELEAGLVDQLAALEPGDIIVSGGPLYDPAAAAGSPVQIEFTGNYALQDAPQVVASALGVDGGGVTTTIQEAFTDQISDGGTVQVWEALDDTTPDAPATYGDEVTDGPQATDDTGAFSLPGLAPGSYVVCADSDTAIAPECEIVVVPDGETLVVVNNLDSAGAIAATATTGQNEIQTLTQDAFLPTGTFVLTFVDGVIGTYTLPIPGGASGAQVESAIGQMSNVGGTANVDCTGGFGLGGGTTVTCEFVGALGGQDFATMTVVNSGNSQVTVAATQEGGTSAVISADELVSGGTFTITFAGQTTAAIDWDATAAEIDAALEALSSVGAGNVEVSGGPLPDTDITVLFVGTLAGTTENLTIDATNIS